jgi:hypothetical protein
MRKPEDKRAIAVERFICDFVRLRCAFSELMFVPITNDMENAPVG